MNLLQPDYSLIVTTLVAFFGPLLVLGWLVVRASRRRSASRAEAAAELALRQQVRLVELAERIETVAEDARRLDDAQRFTTALLAEQRTSERALAPSRAPMDGGPGGS